MRITCTPTGFRKQKPRAHLAGKLWLQHLVSLGSHTLFRVPHDIKEGGFDTLAARGMDLLRILRLVLFNELRLGEVYCSVNGGHTKTTR